MAIWQRKLQTPTVKYHMALALSIHSFLQTSAACPGWICCAADPSGVLIGYASGQYFAPWVGKILVSAPDHGWSKIRKPCREENDQVYFCNGDSSWSLEGVGGIL